jgi:hypothetical protein
VYCGCTCKNNNSTKSYNPWSLSLANTAQKYNTPCIMGNLACTCNIMKSPSPLFTLGSPHPPWCFPPKSSQHKLLRATDCLDHLPELIPDIWVQDPGVREKPLGSVVTRGFLVCLLQGCSISGWLAGRCLDPADEIPLLVWCQDRVDICNVLLAQTKCCHLPVERWQG